VTAPAHREAWLNTVVELLLPTFQREAGIKAFPKLRVSCGFPSTGKRSRVIGECWSPTRSKDSVYELFIHPGQDEPVQVAAVLTHELIHAVVGLEAKHGKAFKAVMKPLGLEGRACATVPGDTFKQIIKPILKEAGRYPHGALVPGGISSNGPKQTTRMIKVHCLGCGYTVRTTHKWIITAVPTCPNEDCGNHEQPMEVAL
jgi:hypothetical protein